MIMPGPRPLIGRRHFLASLLVGTIGVCLPASAAHAATTPMPPGAETLPPAAPAPTTTIFIGEAATSAAATFQPIDDPSVRPFQYHATDAELADLRRRILATKWPERETVDDSTQGVQLATMQKLAEYWAHQHDWRKVEERLNSYPNFVTNIDGLDIHFIHVKSKHPNALPVIITHGWPGSIIEQLKVIEPLTDPTAHGGTAADAFDVVIPSLPGYGFSGKPTRAGWNVPRTAKAWATLMNRLGYTRYVAQGGDWGNAVSEVMALQQPAGLIAIHTNMPATLPAAISKALPAGPAPANLSADEQYAWAQLTDFYTNGLGYAQEMTNRPQTLYALADSPIGLASWMLDHDIQSYKLIAGVFDGAREGLTRDDILDNVTLYWLTNTAVSSARLYWESRGGKGGFFDPRGVQLPVAVSAYASEIYTAPKSWAETAYPKLLHYNRLLKGTHFAAWEQPAAFTDELRASFRTLR
jgi:pimeloyl-ACP methyl ester carboxylesterase